MPNFSPVLVELCERLLSWTDGFTWAIPLKRGSDATELAMRVARTRTGHAHVVMFAHAYHGSNQEQSVLFEGAPADGLRHVSRLPWNDVAALDNFTPANGDSIAAILLNPLDQPGGAQHTFAPTPAFIAAVHRFRDRHGAAIILDDVRNGFRLHPKGSHKAIGLEPDMLCLGKALGNGHGAAALLGVEAMRHGAERILYTSTCLYSAVCCVAAKTTIDVFERDNAFAAMQHAGERLVAGIKKAAQRHGHPITVSGPATHPTILYDNDHDSARMERFCHEVATRGVLIHPRIWSFVSSAHDDAVIDEAIESIDRSLAAIPI
jgi:glutamate-1-semialdehyde 2,1-aminomutase